MKAYTTRVGKGPFVTELNNEVGDKIRIAGNEFGTVTGRPRRCGWFDAVVVRYSARINGLTTIALMLTDVLSEFETIKICSTYDLNDEIIEDFPARLDDLEKCKPVYREVKGWQCDITKCSTYDELPQEVKDYVKTIEEEVGVPVNIISVGPDRAQTIVRDEIF